MDQRTSASVSAAAARRGPGWRLAGLARLRHWFRDGLLRRVFKNAGVLLSGKALGAPFGLGTTRNI